MGFWLGTGNAFMFVGLSRGFVSRTSISGIGNSTVRGTHGVCRSASWRSRKTAWGARVRPASAAGVYAQVPQQPQGNRFDPALIVVRYLDPVFGFGPETVFIIAEDPSTLYELGQPPDRFSQWNASRKIYRARRIVSSALALLLGLVWWPLSIIAAAAYSTFTVVATVIFVVAALVFGFVFWALGEAENRIERLMRS